MISVLQLNYGLVLATAAAPDALLGGVLVVLVPFLLFFFTEDRTSESATLSQRRLSALLLWVTLIGVAAALLGFVFHTVAVYLVIACCVAVLFIALVLSPFTSRLSLPDTGPLARPLRSRRRLRRALKVVGAVALVGVGVLLAGLFKHGSAGPTTFDAQSPYRVYGVCADGACTLNECETPARCGDRHAGVLHEGQHLDIECQLRGGRVEGIGLHSSRIWDRLTNGLYVTDLYVTTHAHNHFNPRLRRCAPWRHSR